MWKDTPLIAINAILTRSVLYQTNQKERKHLLFTSKPHILLSYSVAIPTSTNRTLRDFNEIHFVLCNGNHVHVCVIELVCCGNHMLRCSWIIFQLIEMNVIVLHNPLLLLFIIFIACIPLLLLCSLLLLYACYRSIKVLFDLMCTFSFLLLHLLLFSCSMISIYNMDQVNRKGKNWTGRMLCNVFEFPEKDFLFYLKQKIFPLFFTSKISIYMRMSSHYDVSGRKLTRTTTDVGLRAKKNKTNFHFLWRVSFIERLHSNHDHEF